MARRSRSSSQRMRSRQRDDYSIPNDTVSLLSALLSPAEDLRRWNPEPIELRPPLDILGRPSRFVVAPSVKVHKRSVIARNYYTNAPVGLQAPIGIKVQSAFPVVTCVRRKIRKSVLFALGRTGKGAKAPRRRNDRSNVRC